MREHLEKVGLRAGAMNVETLLICIALLVVATLYSSVGHGGASGYLAVLSLTSFAVMDAGWLKQHAWSLNLVVAAIAFWHYRKAGHHLPRLTVPFILGSVPFAILGGYLRVDGAIYDSLLSLTLVWAAWRLWIVRPADAADEESDHVNGGPAPRVAVPVGAGVGLVSGVIGVGGGIFLSPIILLKRWATPKAAAATAALFIWVNSAAGLFGAGLSGQLTLDSSVLLPFVGVVLIGGFIGSRYGAVIAPQWMIRRLLVLVLMGAAVRLLLGTVGVRI